MKTAEEASQLIEYMENDAKKSKGDVDIKGEDLHEKNDSAEVRQETQPKAEATQDDDFDMLFGENDTSTQAYEEEEENEDNDGNNRTNNVPMIKAEETPSKTNKISILKRHSFAVLLHERKLLNDLALENGEITKTENEKFISYHDKYLCMLKTCVF